MNQFKPEQLDEIFIEIKKIVVNPEYKLRILDLRKFIDEVYPKEADTSREDFNDIKQRFVGLNKRVSHIEECLGIDFKLDSKQNVNYIFIKNEVILDNITSYYREMLRYRYGTRNHKICFGEYCRLATIQIEYLLNYFFTDKRKVRYLDSELKKIATKEFNSKHDKWEENNKKDNEPIYKDIENKVYSNKGEYISNIPLATKNKIFCDNFLKNIYIGDNRISFVSKYTQKMRNRKSHGSINSIDPYENTYLTKEEIKIIGDWYETVQQLVNVYNQEHDNIIIFQDYQLKPGKLGWEKVPEKIKKIYNEGKELVWIFRKPFDEVHQLLYIFANTCSRELKGDKMI